MIFLEDEVPVNTSMSPAGWASLAGCFVGTLRTGHVLILVDCEPDLSILLLLFWEHSKYYPINAKSILSLSPHYLSCET